MFGWWADLNRWAKFGVAFFFLALAVGELLLANRIRFVTWGIGIVLLLLALFVGPTDSQKKGYRF